MIFENKTKLKDYWNKYSKMKVSNNIMREIYV